MTYKILKELMEKHNIPEDVTLMSDSGWECDATHMDCIYYSPVTNCIVFTQYPSVHDTYHKKPGDLYYNEKVDLKWELLYGEYDSYHLKEYPNKIKNVKGAEK